MNVFLDIDSGLQHARKHAETLCNEYKDYFATVGVDWDVQAINEAAAVCWAWGAWFVHRRTQIISFGNKISCKIIKSAKDSSKSILKTLKINNNGM